MYQKKLEIEYRCPLDKVLEIFKGKWSIRIYCLIVQEGSVRYTDFRKKLSELSDPVLASTLKYLIRYGIIERKAFDEMPVRVEYVCTERGKALIPVLKGLCKWGNQICKDEETDYVKILPNCRACESFGEE